MLQGLPEVQFVKEVRSREYRVGAAGLSVSCKDSSHSFLQPLKFLLSKEGLVPLRLGNYRNPWLAGL